MPISTSIMAVERHQEALRDADWRRRMAVLQADRAAGMAERKMKLAEAEGERKGRLFEHDLAGREERGYGIKDLDPNRYLEMVHQGIPESRATIRATDALAGARTATGQRLADQTRLDWDKRERIELPESQATAAATKELGGARRETARHMAAQTKTEDELRPARVGRGVAEEAEAGSKAAREALGYTRDRFEFQEEAPAKAAKVKSEAETAAREAEIKGVESAWAQHLKEVEAMTGQVGLERERALAEKAAAELQDYIAGAPLRGLEAQAKGAKAEGEIRDAQGKQVLARVGAWLFGGMEAGTADGPGAAGGRPTPARLAAAANMISTSPLISLADKKAALDVVQDMLGGKKPERGALKAFNLGTADDPIKVLGFEGGPEHGMFQFMPGAPGEGEALGTAAHIAPINVRGLTGQMLGGQQPTRIEDIMAGGQQVADQARGAAPASGAPEQQAGQVFFTPEPPGPAPQGYQWRRHFEAGDMFTPARSGWRLVRTFGISQRATPSMFGGLQDALSP